MKCKTCKGFGFVDFCECANAGADVAATKLLEIAETGKHAGVFGGEPMETAAQSILALHARINGLVKRLGEAHPASAHPISFRRKR